MCREHATSLRHVNLQMAAIRITPDTGVLTDRVWSVQNECGFERPAQQRYTLVSAPTMVMPTALLVRLASGRPWMRTQFHRHFSSPRLVYA